MAADFRFKPMLNISVRQLHYFIALVKAGSFSRAAEAVGVTQSTLSAAIQTLEAEIGVTLIDRTGRRMQLLPAGEDFLNRAREIVASIEELPEHARQAERPLTTRLRLGVIPSIAPFLLPKVLPTTAKAFPELQLSVREGLTRTLLDNLRSGTLDVALVAHPYDLDDFEVADIGQDPFFLRYAATMPWPIETALKQVIFKTNRFFCWRLVIVCVNMSWQPLVQSQHRQVAMFMQPAS